jgi:hypothetical protein
MFASLRALLSGLIDYAGLFPPAKLPLDSAIRNYARYRQEADVWMLGRFIIPAARLAELTPFHDEFFRSEPPFVFSALGRGGATEKEFLASLKSDLQDIAAFRARHGDRVRVDVLETRVPADLALPEIAGPVKSAGLLLFCEGASGLMEQLGRMRVIGEQIGFKLRCGGLEASAFPTSQQIAVALRDSLDAGVPFKATAGLHHPLPRFDPGVKVRMHGFVNVFLAGVLAHTRRLTAEQICLILDDDCPEHFHFDDEKANWRDVQASTAEIAASRREAMLSFGSCSFDEPREDLRSLQWL